MTKAEEKSIVYQLATHGPRVMGGDAILSEDDCKFWNINYDFKAGYEEAEKDLGWVSVKDRLPEESGFQLACIELYGVAQCVGLYYFDAEKKSWIDFDDEVCTVFIDYWMEVPKLPEK